MSKTHISIIVIVVIILIGGVYWYLRGDALYVQPLSDTKSVVMRDVKIPKAADLESPNVRCYPVANHRVVMQLDKTNMSLCTIMSEQQTVQFSNTTDRNLTVTFASHTETVEAGKHLVFSQPVGNFLAEGVHLIRIVEQPDRILEVYVLSLDTLREACAHSEIPTQGEKDTAQDALSPLVVVRWTDERGGENIVPLIYEPEMDFAGCSESAKEFLRHLPNDTDKS